MPALVEIAARTVGATRGERESREREGLGIAHRRARRVEETSFAVTRRAKNEEREG